MKKVLSALGIGLLLTGAVATNLNSVHLSSNSNETTQKTSTKASSVEVNNYDEFLNAMNDTNVEVINLGSDIDLSNATPTGNDISNKTINGYGHSFFNYDYALNDDSFESSEYLFNSLNNLVLNNIVFDNVIGFAKSYNYSDANSSDITPLKNITIENISLDEEYTSSEDLGLLFNEVSIQVNESDNSELTVIDGLTVANNSFRSENETSINIFSSEFTFLNTYDLVLANLPLFTDIAILNNEVLNSNEVKVIKNSDIGYTIGGSVQKGFSITNIVISQNMVDSTSELSFIEINGSITNLFIENLVSFNYYETENVEQGNTYLVSNGSTNSSIANFNGLGTIYIIDNINNQTPSASNQNIVEGYSDDSMGGNRIKYFSVINTIQNKTDYEKVNTIFNSIFGKYGLDQTINTNGDLIDLDLVLQDSLSMLKINTTLNKKGQIGQITFYFSVNLKTVYDTSGSVTLTNSVLRISNSDDLNNYNSYNANQSKVTDDSTPWFELSFNLNGDYKVSDLTSKEMILVATASDSASNTKKSKELYFEVDEQEVVDYINSGAINNVLFINQAAKISTIVLTVILLIIIIIFIILLILNIMKKRRIAKVTETQGGYYKYVENDPIEQDTYDDYNYDDYNYENYDNYDNYDENNY